MLLGHRYIRAVETIQDQLTKKWETNFLFEFDMLFSLVVHQIQVIAGVVAPDINVFSDLNHSICAGYEGAPISPN